jgi:hypothetical protein
MGDTTATQNDNTIVHWKRIGDLEKHKTAYGFVFALSSVEELAKELCPLFPGLLNKSRMIEYFGLEKIESFDERAQRLKVLESEHRIVVENRTESDNTLSNQIADNTIMEITHSFTAMLSEQPRLLANTIIGLLLKYVSVSSTQDHFLLEFYCGKDEAFEYCLIDVQLVINWQRNWLIWSTKEELLKVSTQTLSGYMPK